MTTKKILVLAGDGIGPEVMRQVRRVIDWFDARGRMHFEITEGLVGGCSYDAHGTPLTDETMAQAMESDAVLLGAVGGPKWDSLPFDKKPERGLLRLRKDMALFANLRPALVFDALADASTLKTELVKGLDIMIVRELTGGVYFGEPRGADWRTAPYPCEDAAGRAPAFYRKASCPISVRRRRPKARRRIPWLAPSFRR